MSHRPTDHSESSPATVPQDIEAWIVRPLALSLQQAPQAPLLSSAAAVLLRAVDVVDEHGERRSLRIPMERPLTVVLNAVPLVTLMTLGAAPEFLVLGYLRNQRIIRAVSDVRSIAVEWRAGIATVTAPNAEMTDRARAPSVVHSVGSACALGTVFGDVLQGAAVLDFAAAPRTSRAALLRILDTMQTYDAIHRAAGSVHSCAVFRGSELLVAIEDVSRHNAVDTVVGWMLQHGVSGAETTLFTTGRLTAELVMKAALNGIAVLVSRNGMTALGYELAAKLGMSVFARATKQRYTVYLGAERLDD